MATWFHFTSDYNHYWPSRAWTEFREGMKVYVKDSVAEAAKEAGAGKPLNAKPKDDDPGYVPTTYSEESPTRIYPGNPVKRNAPPEAEVDTAVIPAPDTGGSVIGDALSPASGGEQTEKAAEAADHIDIPVTGTAGRGDSGGIKGIDTRTMARDQVTGEGTQADKAKDKK